MKKSFQLVLGLLSLLFFAACNTQVDLSKVQNEADITLNTSSPEGDWYLFKEDIPYTGKVKIEFSASIAVNNPNSAPQNLLWQIILQYEKPEYPIVASRPFSSGITDYVEVKGEGFFDIPKETSFYLSTFNLGKDVEIYIKDYKFNLTQVNIGTQDTENENGLTLKGGAAKSGMSMGAVLSEDTFKIQAYKDLLVADYNSISFANELKPYSLLDRDKSKQSGKPSFNWSKVDPMLKFCKDNNLKVRGHVLVWDSVMDQDWHNWFFKENFDSNGALVDSETMKARVKSMIEDIMNYCEDNYSGVIYAWDVVNEAVADNWNDAEGTTASNNPCRIRTLRNGAKNYYYETIGLDYVKYSFECADKVRDEIKEKNGNDILLFYNDYSSFIPEKRDHICELIKEINSEEKLCDGMGMQSYIGGWADTDEKRQQGCFSTNDLNNHKAAVEKYSALGVEVHITECAIRNFYNTESALKKHKEFYVEFVKQIEDLNSGSTPKITNFSIWGLTDLPSTVTDSNYSYTMNGPYAGLYESLNESFTYTKKDVYYAILEELNN